MPGGVGAGIYSQGIPTITQLVSHFSGQHEVHVFMHALPDANFRAKAFYLHSSPKWISFSSLRWLYLMLFFVISFPKNKFSAVLSFWAYPSGTIAILLAKIFRIPSILFILGGETACLPQINYGLLRKPVLRKIVLWTCSKCSVLLSVSQYQIDQLKKYGFGREALVIPWGADRNIFFETKKERTSTLKIIHVANLNLVKDQETLIKAFDIIQKQVKAQLKIVGPDTMNGKIQQLVRARDLEHVVEFMGGLPYAQIQEQLAWADLFMLTSLSEGQNNAITEAMTCGLLAVSTRVGIMNDLGDDFGIVVDVGDYQTLAEKVIAIANDPLAWQSKVMRSTQWSNSHDLSWTLKRLDECLNPIINSRA